MSSRYLIIGVWEHLNFNSLQDGAIKNHILSFEKCSNNWFNKNNFVTICKCINKSEFRFQIHEALTHKKVKSKIKSTNASKWNFIFIEYILIAIFSFYDIIIWNLIYINLIFYMF